MANGDPPTPEPFGVAQTFVAPPRFEPVPFGAPALLPAPRAPRSLPPLLDRLPEFAGDLPGQVLAPPPPIEEPPELGEFAPMVIERPPPPQVIAATQPTALPTPGAPQAFLPAPGIAAAQPAGVARPAGIAPPDPLAVNEELTTTLTNVSELGEQRTILRRQASNLQAQIALEQDPAKRNGLVAQQQETVSALQLTDAELAANQEQAAVVGAEADARQQVEATRAQLDARQQAIETQRQQRAEAVLDEEERQRARDAAQVEITRTKERRIQVIRKGAPELVGRTIGEMFAEALAATNEKRPANFSSVFARLRTDAQEVLQRETEASTEEVRLGVDRAADLARQQERRRLLDAAADEAVLEDILTDVDQRIARAGNERDQQALLGVRAAAQDQLDAARAKSAVVAEAAGRKAAKERAEIAKLNAEAMEKRARAAKEERRGRRGGRGGGATKAQRKEAALSIFRKELRPLAAIDPKAAREVEKRGLIDPFSGAILRNADNTPVLAQTEALAKELRGKALATVEVNRIIEEIVSLRAASGFEFTHAGLATPEGKRMQSAFQDLVLVLKNQKELGALSSDDQDLLRQLSGGDPTGVDDPTPALRRVQASGAKSLQEAYRIPGYTGTLAVPITRAKPEAKLEDIETNLDADFDRRTGRHGLTTDEFKAKVKEERAVIERDASRPSEGKFGATPGVEGVRAKRLSFEVAAERNQNRLEALTRRDVEMGKLIDQAREVGDKKLESQLVASRKENVKRRDFLREEVKRLTRDVAEFDTEGRRNREDAASRFGRLEESGLGDAF